MKYMLSAIIMTLATSVYAQSNENNVAELIKAAKKEGQIYSVGMPDSWANWQGTWQDLSQQYGIKHQDTDMSSAQEIAKFAAEKIKLLLILAMSGHHLVQ